MSDIPLTPLSRLITARLERRGWAGMSTRELAAESNGRLSKDVVSMYRSGRHPATPSETTLEAWADILDVPITELREAAALSPGEGDLGRYEPPAESVRLTRRQRIALDELIRSFVGRSGVVTGGVQWEGIAHGESPSVTQSVHGSSTSNQNVRVDYAKSGTVATNGAVNDDEVVGSLAPEELDKPGPPAVAPRPRGTGSRRRRAGS